MLPPCPPRPLPARLQFSAKGADHFVASVGSSLLPAARAEAAIPGGSSSVVVLSAVLVPAGVKAVPKPTPPPPPPKKSPPRPKAKGGIGGGNPAVNYYLGCFAGGGYKAPYLPKFLSASSTMTKSFCATKASAANLPYFGMQGRNSCWGGSSLPMAQSMGLSTNCTDRCNGDANQICGGTNATTLYSFERPSLPTPTCTVNSCYLSLGCFTDPFCSKNTRLGMEQKLTPKEICRTTVFNTRECSPAVPSASVPLCADLAKAYYFRYFSLQNGTDCYGSNSTAYAMSLGLSTACNTTCRDDASATCGGSCANAIYQVGWAGGLQQSPPTPASPACSPALALSQS